MSDQLTSVEAKRVLVAADDPHDQMLFIMAAEDAAARIKLEFMPNGEEFLTELRRLAADERLPTMAVLDMGMRRMNGHQVLDVLIDEPGIRPAEVGIFCASHHDEDVVASLAKGAAWHEVKPNRFEELVAFVRRIDQRCDELSR